MKFEELTPEEQEAARAFREALAKPPEYYNGVINSGFCNGIITGYIMLAFDELGLTKELDSRAKGIIGRLFDHYDAEDARERYKNS